MSEGGGRGGISQIVSGHVDGLHRGDGALGGGGDTLLHGTHVSGQRGLVTYSRGDTTQQGRHLGGIATIEQCYYGPGILPPSFAFLSRLNCSYFCTHP